MTSEAIGRMGTEEGVPGEPRARYLLYGLQVDSDIRLPVASATSAADACAWTFRQANPWERAPEPDGPAIAVMQDDRGADMVARYHGPGGDWIWNRSLGTFHIRPSVRQVDVYPDPTADEALLGLVLAGQVSIAILRLLGCPCLHASAVETALGAAAFLGSHGQGKSTMAACFLRRGAALVTDDALPLRLREDGIYGGPALPMMKMWRDTANAALELSEELPNLAPALTKKLLTLGDRYPFVRWPVRLRAFYVLDRYDAAAANRVDVRVRALSPRDSLLVLLAQTSWNALAQPAEVASFFPLYLQLLSQMPIRVLSFPHGYEYHDAVYTEIMRTLEQR
jgi:hypothetical protein